MNSMSLMGQPSDGYAVAVEDGEVLFWTEEQCWQMANEHPLMMMELSKVLLRAKGIGHIYNRYIGSRLNMIGYKLLGQYVIYKL